MTIDNNGGGSGQPDYAAIDTPDPDEEPYEEWHWSARRAYLYREWVDAGTHRLMNKSQLAEQFGVTRKTLYNDLDKIAEFADQILGEKHGAQTVGVLERAVAELLSQGDYKRAADVQMMMGDWLERRGAVDRDPQSDREIGVGPEDLDDEDLEWLEEAF